MAYYIALLIFSGVYVTVSYALSGHRRRQNRWSLAYALLLVGSGIIICTSCWWMLAFR